MSEAAGEDVGAAAAVRSYIAGVLPHVPERTAAAPADDLDEV
jgi:hypothetical protein